MEVDREELRRVAWAVKTAPGCQEWCPAKMPNGLCTCGAVNHRSKAAREFSEAVTPDAVLGLIGGA